MKKTARKKEVNQAAIEGQRWLPLAGVMFTLRRGLRELAIESGINTLSALLEQERTESCGARYKHDPERRAFRGGHAKGELAQPPQLLALLGGQRPRLALALVSPGPIDPGPHGRRGQIEIARHLGSGLALVQHQPHRAGFELVREAPFRPPLLLWLVRHAPHRIRLSKGVYETGSSPDRTHLRSLQ